jgi:predicted ATPase
MPRFILTGAPGAGKTAVLRQLERDGFPVVEEAASDVIALELARGVAEPHACAGFVDAIVDLQRRRQISAALARDVVQFHDRSAVCTLALARFLGVPASEVLAGELARIEAGAIFARQVFFLRNLGFVTPTAARRISFEAAVRFEAVHEQAYRDLGYDLVPIAAGPVAERARAIAALAASPPPMVDEGRA